MSEISTFIMWRFIERIIIAFIGGFSLWMGWNLFRNGIFTMQNADFKAAGFSLKLNKVGPGIFFALFGTFILVTSVNSAMSIKTIDDFSSAPKDGTTESVQHNSGFAISYYGSGKDSKNKRLLLAINSIDQLSQELKKDAFNKHQMSELNDAVAVLNQFHFWKFNNIFKEENKIYTKIISDIRNLSKDDKDKYIENLSNDERQIYTNLNEWMRGRIK